MNEQRITTPNAVSDDTYDVALRPRLLNDFIGQHKLKENLHVFITAARLRNDPIDHILFYGPPGLGKTTLSQIVAHELQVNIKITAGPMISKTGELAAVLTNLQPNDVLFIDEIHRLNAAVEELLYSAMEDYSIDLIIGEGPAARTVKINLPAFTLIGATTRMGMLSAPLRDRFGILLKLEFYSAAELQEVIQRGASLMKLNISKEAASELAQSARGTPRIAIRLLKRIRDFAHYGGVSDVNLKIVQEALLALGVDSLGLDSLDYTYMKYIDTNYAGGPVGIENISAGLSEDKGTIEEVIEPYLMQIGFIARTPRGRVITERCIEYIRKKSDKSP